MSEDGNEITIPLKISESLKSKVISDPKIEEDVFKIMYSSTPPIKMKEGIDREVSRRLPDNIRDQFMKRSAEIANEFNIDPHVFLLNMLMESGMSTTLPNPESNAVGLIQWLSRTKENDPSGKLYVMGKYPLEDVKKMNHLQQLELVREYYKNSGIKTNKKSSILETRMLTFYPKMAYRLNEDDYILGSGDPRPDFPQKVAKQNHLIGDNGVVRLGELKRHQAKLTYGKLKSYGLY